MNGCLNGSILAETGDGLRLNGDRDADRILLVMVSLPPRPSSGFR